ncbi:hypothetical protein E2C01_015051 [Portunus trituberculatus]|uniref:Uncharacterized protein n=1 Tax=Portunus trituberculatus TaxID=210409 RepID=A0A5B7DLI8_PORTR|nr:hypothetical protein [Portunus trituberculatus]
MKGVVGAKEVSTDIFFSVDSTGTLKEEQPPLQHRHWRNTTWRCEEGRRRRRRRRRRRGKVEEGEEEEEKKEEEEEEEYIGIHKKDE